MTILVKLFYLTFIRIFIYLKIIHFYFPQFCTFSQKSKLQLVITLWNRRILRCYRVIWASKADYYRFLTLIRKNYENWYFWNFAEHQVISFRIFIKRSWNFENPHQKWSENADFGKIAKMLMSCSSYFGFRSSEKCVKVLDSERYWKQIWIEIIGL